MEELQLIDVLSEDDLLIASHLDDGLEDFRVSVLLENIDEHEDLKLIGTQSSQEAENAAEILKKREQKVLFSQSMECGRPCNLRKSLAWDSSFFTSAGVLDPEELFMINRGLEKSEAHLLPKTRQDLRKRRSVDLESALDSDGFYFESNQSNEVLLFEDVRASIQRTSIMSSLFNSGCKSAVGEARKQKTRSLKKPDDVSRNRVKSMPISRRQSIYVQGSERIKEVVHPQIVQHSTRSGESNLFFRKPPKILRMMNPVSPGQTTKISPGADPFKMEKKTGTSGCRQGLMACKKSGAGNSCCSSSSIASTTSSSSVSVAASNDSSASWSPSCKPPTSPRRKTDSRKTRLAAPGSSSMTPLRCSPGGSSRLGNHSSSTHLSSMSNQPSYASSACSFDGWSSESSSTSAEHKSISLEANFYSSNSRGYFFRNFSTQALDLQSHSHDQLFYHQESQQTRLLNQHIDEVTGTGNASAESTRNFRPSGLRMPSPKMGFFDEEKSPVQLISPGLQLRFGAQSDMPINGTTNGKRPGSEKTGVLTPRYAARNQEQVKNSPNVLSISATSRNFPRRAPKGQRDMSPQFCREHCSKTRRVGDGDHATRKLGLESSLKAERIRTKGMLKNDMSKGNKRHVHRVRASRIHPSKDEPLASKADMTQSKKENGRARAHHLENHPHSLCKNEKENLPSLEDHVKGLSRYFEAIDLNGDMVIELNGKKKKKGCSRPKFGHNYTENDRAPVSSPSSGEYLLCRQQVSPSVPAKPVSLLDSVAAVEFVPSARTPLADINSACNGAEPFVFMTE